MKRRTRRLGLPIPALLLCTALAVSACGAKTNSSSSGGGNGGEPAAVA